MNAKTKEVSSWEMEGRGFPRKSDVDFESKPRKSLSKRHALIFSLVHQDPHNPPPAAGLSLKGRPDPRSPSRTSRWPIGSLQGTVFAPFFLSISLFHTFSLLSGLNALFGCPLLTRALIGKLLKLFGHFKLLVIVHHLVFNALVIP